MNPSNQLREFTKGWEELRTTPYLDTQTLTEVWTVGWGHVLDNEEPRGPWTYDQCCTALDADLEEAARQVETVVGASWLLQQHEFDALVDFVFNLGAKRLQDSTLLRLLKGGQMGAAAAEFTKWDRAGGKPNLGVLRRHCAEQAIFLCADYSRRP
jgi:lysozyme